MKGLLGAMLAFCCVVLCACASIAAPKAQVMDFASAPPVYETPVQQERPQASAEPAIETQIVSEAALIPGGDMATESVPAQADSPRPTPAPASRPDTPLATPAPQVDAAELKPADAPTVAASGSAAEKELAVRISAMEYVYQALARAGINAGQTKFHVRITHDAPELFSCVAEIAGKPARGGYTLYPVTVDMQSGTVCSLSDFFSSTDLGWRSLLPDIVTSIAVARGMTLLCEVPPVAGDQPFYIENGSIVLVYRPYEITTYEAGEPRFILPMEEIAEYTTGAYGVGG